MVDAKALGSTYEEEAQLATATRGQGGRRPYQQQDSCGLD